MNDIPETAMNRGVLAIALAAVLIPAAANAQIQPLREDVTGPTLRVTPFIGHLTSFERIEEWRSFAGSQVSHVRVSHNVAGGTAAGLNLEVPLSGRFGVTAAGAYASRDRAALMTNTGEAFLIDGNDVFLGRLGAVMHLREEPSEFVLRRMGASIFAGGVVMHERPGNALGTAEFASNGTHFGINAGVNGELPFGGDRFAVQVGIEDNVMWWSEAPLASVASEYFSAAAAETTVSTDMSHTWLFRAGISVRAR